MLRQTALVLAPKLTVLGVCSGIGSELLALVKSVGSDAIEKMYIIENDESCVAVLQKFARDWKIELEVVLDGNALHKDLPGQLQRYARQLEVG